MRFHVENVTTWENVVKEEGWTECTQRTHGQPLVCVSKDLWELKTRQGAEFYKSLRRISGAGKSAYKTRFPEGGYPENNLKMSERKRFLVVFASVTSRKIHPEGRYPPSGNRVLSPEIRKIPDIRQGDLIFLPGESRSSSADIAPVWEVWMMNANLSKCCWLFFYFINDKSSESLVIFSIIIIIYNYLMLNLKI